MWGGSPSARLMVSLAVAGRPRRLGPPGRCLLALVHEGRGEGQGPAPGLCNMCSASNLQQWHALPCPHAGAVGHGGHYHSQSPEAFFTHIPGVKARQRAGAGG